MPRTTYPASASERKQPLRVRRRSRAATSENLSAGDEPSPVGGSAARWCCARRGTEARYRQSPVSLGSRSASPSLATGARRRQPSAASAWLRVHRSLPIGRSVPIGSLPRVHRKEGTILQFNSYLSDGEVTCPLAIVPISYSPPSSSLTNRQSCIVNYIPIYSYSQSLTHSHQCRMFIFITPHHLTINHSNPSLSTILLCR